jgi:pyridoxamine 5'-phosphate oxidase
VSDLLPDPLPANPLPLVHGWYEEAQREISTASAMALATVTPEGRPSARMVICRGLDTEAGWLVFYTDRDSHKGEALAKHPWASLVFYWAAVARQVRVDGPVTHAPEADSDAYWRGRPRDANVAAVASDQSRPLAARADFLARMAAVSARYPGAVPRPPRWGGYRVWAERVELWAGQPARAHDRAVWARELRATGDGYAGGAWSATRLQP